MWSGRHSSVRLGESLDFADYREYTPGDDFRRIDHQLWARLGVILVRRYQAEEELTLRLVIDASASMGYEEKLETARRLAAMVGYLALAGGDRVQPICLGGAGSCRSVIGPLGRHLSSWPQIERWLERIEPGGAAALEEAAIRSGSPGAARPGVLVSDLLDPGWESAIDKLGATGGGLVLQVLGGVSSIRHWLATSTSSTARPGSGSRSPLRSRHSTDISTGSRNSSLRWRGGPSLRDGPPGGRARLAGGSRAATGRGGGSAVRFLVPAALGVAALAVPLLRSMLRSRRQRTPVSSVYLWDQVGNPVSSAVPGSASAPPLLLAQLAVLALFALLLASLLPPGDRARTAHRLRDGHVRARWRWRVGWSGRW